MKVLNIVASNKNKEKTANSGASVPLFMGIADVNKHIESVLKGALLKTELS